MKRFKFQRLKLFLCALVMAIASCQKHSPCERYYIPENFTGEVTVYYEQDKGEKNLDSQGCIVHHISNKGDCFSAWPYKKDGTLVTPGETYQFFLVDSNGNITTEIFDFNQPGHSDNVASDKTKKYIGRYFGGERNGNYVSGFYVGYRTDFVK
jgi:hypothetical protein